MLCLVGGSAAVVAICGLVDVTIGVLQVAVNCCCRCSCCFCCCCCCCCCWLSFCCCCGFVDLWIGVAVGVCLQESSQKPEF